MMNKPSYPTEEKTYDLANESPGDTKTRVLILEDDAEFAHMLETHLKANSFSVTRVSNGAEGIRQIMVSDFDIILCDLVMPTLPGDMFYQAVERTKPLLCKRFIFISGHRADPKWDAFVRRVKGLVLWKPFSMHDLMATIQTVLQKSGQPAPGKK